MDCRLVSIAILLATASLLRAADLPPGAVLQLGDSRYRAGGELTDLTFSPDGTRVTSWVSAGGWDDRAIVWDVATGKPIETVVVRGSRGGRVRWSSASFPDSDRGLVVGADGVAVVRDFHTGKDLARLTGHCARVTTVAVSADGKRMATASADGLIRVWDAETFRPLNEPKGHIGPIRWVDVSADGRYAVTTGADRTARVWDLITGRELRAFPSSGATAARFTIGGTGIRLSQNEQVVVRDLVTGLEMLSPSEPRAELFPLTQALLRLGGVCVAVSPDGRMVAIGTRTGGVELYETATGNVRRHLTGHGGTCYSVAFTPDGSRLVTGGADHVALIWPVRVQDMPLPVALKQETNALRLWERLADPDSVVAYLAMARLAADPGAAVKIARLKLRPEVVADPDVMTNPLPDTRTVELLEAIGTLEARKLLRELAAGDRTLLRTRDARLALLRLGEPRDNPTDIRTTSGSQP